MKETPSVLIVDDDENTCRILKLIFDKKGYEADIARTGKEALEQARERFYNLILLDIKLPDMDGTDLISPLKDTSPDSTIIMVTAFASLESALRALHEGATAYITKPLNVDEVLALAKRFLEGQRLVVDKRRAEDALRKSEAKYRTILQSMHDQVFIIDNHDCYSQYYSASKELLYVSPRDFMGRRVSEVLPPLVAERFAEFFQRVRETKQSETLDYQLEMDGQKHWFSAVLSLHEDGESIVQVVRDITRRKQAEGALREERNKAQMYLDVAGAMLVALDANGTVTMINRRGCEILGIDAEEVIGKDWVSSFLPERFRLEVRGVIAKLVAGDLEPVEYYENPILTKNGDERAILWHNSFMTDEAGKTIGIFTSGEDITERKRAEEQLRESEKMYRLLAENTFDCVWQMDLSTKFTYVNPAIFRVFGFTPEEWIGSSLGEHCSPEAMEFVSDIMMETIRQGSNAIPETFETRMLRKDRKEIDVEITAELILDKDTNPLVFQGTTRDITERKRAEGALREERDKAQMYLDIAGVMLVVLDADGRVTLMNRQGCEILGYDSKEIIGKDWFKTFLPKRLRIEVRAVFAQLMVGTVESVEYYENPILTRNGEERVILWHNSLMTDEAGKIVGLLSSGEDITERKRAQDALVGSEREKSAILNGMEDLVVYYNSPDMTIVWANRAAAEDVNLSVDKLIGKHCCKIWHQRDESLDACPVVRAFKTGQPEEEETISPDGRTWFVRGWPVKDDEGRTIGVVKVSRNATEQKLAEEALRESEEWFRAVYEESPIAINVFNRNGNLIHMNPACVDFAGVSSLEDLKDFNIFEDPNFPEDKKQQLRNGESVLFRSTIDWSKVKEARLYDTIKSGVSYVETGASPLKYGEDESLHGYMIQMVDITDRVLAEKEVRASEKRYRGLVERMSEVVFRLSVPDAEYEYMSPSSSPLLGYPAEEFLDNPLLFLKVVHPDSMDYFMGAFVDMVENNVFSTIEYKIIDTSGNTKWVSQSNSPVYDDEGNLIAVEGICRDVSDRKKAEEDMRTAAETAMLYLDLMGHDIRNHLQAIIMGTEILEQLDIKPEVREMVDIVVESVEKSRSLIKKVQATRELLSIPLSSTPLREALENCLQVLNETHDDVQIEVNLTAQQLTVIADKYLESLLMNILENAILHNDKKIRRVWLDLREAGGGYEVVIADNGPGISDEKKENLFDQSRRFGGVGVHQAFKITQKYGGRITVQDRVPGDSSKGTEFHIWFPKSTP